MQQRPKPLLVARWPGMRPRNDTLHCDESLRGGVYRGATCFTRRRTPGLCKEDQRALSKPIAECMQTEDRPASLAWALLTLI